MWTLSNAIERLIGENFTASSMRRSRRTISLAARTGVTAQARQAGLGGRGAMIGYTGAYRELARVDVQEVAAVQTARGPE